MDIVTILSGIAEDMHDPMVHVHTTTIHSTRSQGKAMKATHLFIQKEVDHSLSHHTNPAPDQQKARAPSSLWCTTSPRGACSGEAHGLPATPSHRYRTPRRHQGGLGTVGSGDPVRDHLQIQDWHSLCRRRGIGEREGG
jgi:hypothetical protein